MPAVQPSLLVQPSPGKKFKMETVSDNIVMVPVSHRYGVGSPKFIWAPVLDSLAETPATLPPLLPPSVGFIYDGAIGQP
jgi:hypothetical protein